MNNAVITAEILRELEKQGLIEISTKDLFDLARLARIATINVDMEAIRRGMKELERMDTQERWKKLRAAELSN